MFVLDAVLMKLRSNACNKPCDHPLEQGFWPARKTQTQSMCFLQVMVEVSRLVERRMLRRADRSAAYAAYQRRTPFWLGLRRPQREC